MITHKIQLRPRYGEVDQMGYVYHANYVTYFHQARTELLRTMRINDKILEDNNIMLPVIETNIKYKNPAHYDELLTIQTKISTMPSSRFVFEFEISNENKKLVCVGTSTVVFVDSISRKPMVVPKLIENALHSAIKNTTLSLQTK